MARSIQNPLSAPFADGESLAPATLRERTIVVVIVVALHVALLMVWAKLPPTAPDQPRELEVTFAAAPAPVVAPQQAPLPQPVKVVTMPQRVENPAPAPVQLPVPAPLPVQEAAAPVVQPRAPEPEVTLPPEMQLQAVEVPAVEPDYNASCLNNPKPPYPYAARRMGLQGMVVLNIEVLADGSSGQVKLQQGSGHDMLDKAAMQAVKDWHCIPARQGGRVITKWYIFAVTYSLKDKEQ